MTGLRPLHVCYVSQEYPPETGWGGIGSYTYEMARGLVRAGHRVTVISRAPGQPSVQTSDGVVVHRVAPALDVSHLHGIWRFNGYWPGFAWAAAERVLRVHAASTVDIVEAGEGRADGFFVPWLPGGPRVVVRLHTAWIFVDTINSVAPTRNKRFLYWLEKESITRADLITAPSRAVVDLTASWVARAGSGAVVPNPVDSGMFAPRPRKESGRVLYVGRLETRKGMRALAEAVPRVLQRSPTSSFQFVGVDAGDARGRPWRDVIFEKLPRSDWHRVGFEQVGRSDLRDRYRSADVCVLPSLWENFPYALLEAMSCGVPVVATRTGGLPELVEDGVSGLLVPPEDPAALAGALSRLLEDTTLRETMGRNARKRVETHFSTDRIVPRMVEVYRSIVEKPR